MKERENFGSRLGFILVSAGCAIGIGNVWKFPYVAGANGGGIFVLFYLLFLVILGVPVMTMELAVGRASRKSAVGGFKKLEPAGSRWHIYGWFCTAGCALLMMYYTTVSGWMMAYAWKFATGQFAGIGDDSIGDVFSGMLADPFEMGIFMVITVVAGFLVCSFGVQGGIEKITKYMMLGLLVLIILLAGHSFVLPGAAEGISFFLMPSVENVKDVGLINVIVAAMNQAFFTLSLGIGAIEIFGSYMGDSHSLAGEAVRISILDTFVAIISGLIIFPACFSYNVSPDNGPSLIFITLPRVFNHMAAGRLWGFLFFIFMTFASFSTVTAVFENLIAAGIDNLGWSRKKSVAVNLIFILIASIPCVLGYNVWSGVHLIKGGNVLDTEDFLVSNMLLPAGSLIFALFCVSRFGWRFENFLKEANTGDGIKLSPALKNYFRFVLPVLVLIILITGLV
ncbi:MAG: sodium-dependent transporter [Lachnospiraceae bacterium]|nr:sodium-dependent transporter [Lachnospiraceae bacterium]